MIFCAKTKTLIHPLLCYNDTYVQEAYAQQTAFQKNSFVNTSKLD